MCNGVYLGDALGDVITKYHIGEYQIVERILLYASLVTPIQSSYTFMLPNKFISYLKCVEEGFSSVGLLMHFLCY